MPQCNLPGQDYFDAVNAAAAKVAQRGEAPWSMESMLLVAGHLAARAHPACRKPSRLGLAASDSGWAVVASLPAAHDGRLLAVDAAFGEARQCGGLGSSLPRPPAGARAPGAATEREQQNAGEGRRFDADAPGHALLSRFRGGGRAAVGGEHRGDAALASGNPAVEARLPAQAELSVEPLASVPRQVVHEIARLAQHRPAPRDLVEPPHAAGRSGVRGGVPHSVHAPRREAGAGVRLAGDQAPVEAVRGQAEEVGHAAPRGLIAQVLGPQGEKVLRA
eukprot:CAMPEP_0198613448 /NCGR_PEP_ID=MMETSP1462-20131121/158399_1 /TAXON_ID=1333877 /ORGANISM="Brandtodinium nutriculum, Strain RCC3387" /LENGTH=276 /DNA_ID=CAMNT_0044345247 /DNA_START=433 /DNA_END=1261 /DNA_ORIENTATION=-